MDLLDHLRELRKRLILSILAVLLASTIGYFYTGPVFRLLSGPYFEAFPGQIMIGTGPAEAFVLRLKLSVFSGIMLASPFLFLQLWLFVSPGLYSEEKRLVVPFLLSTTLLLLGGVWFCYQVVMPFSFAFFYDQYRELGITPTITISEHMSFMTWGILGFGLVFEMPVVAYFLAKLGTIDSRMLIGGFRYAVVVIFVVAAVLTPPDVLTQFLMAGPLLILYGISIVVVHFTRPIDRPERPLESDEQSKVPIGGM